MRGSRSIKPSCPSQLRAKIQPEPPRRHVRCHSWPYEHLHQPPHNPRALALPRAALHRAFLSSTFIFRTIHSSPRKAEAMNKHTPTAPQPGQPEGSTGLTLCPAAGPRIQQQQGAPSFRKTSKQQAVQACAVKQRCSLPAPTPSIPNPTPRVHAQPNLVHPYPIQPHAHRSEPGNRIRRTRCQAGDGPGS